MNGEELTQSTGREVPQPEKLAKLGLMVAGIAHNLYGPLTGIIGTLDLLRLKQPDLAGDLERINGLTKRLQDEIRVMLFKAEIEYRGKIGMVDLVALIQNELEFYKADPRLKHMTEVVFEPPEEVPQFRGTIGDFSQSISNIITNAVEAMVESETKKLTISLEVSANTIVLHFADTGVGMDEKTLAHAFDPFFTTKKPEASSKYPDTLATGLGLSHARNLLEPQGVKLELASKLGEGTEVMMTIPYKEIDERNSAL